MQPDLPIWIGGSSEAAVRRTARYGTGWQAGAETPADVGRVIAAIKAAVADAGRSIDEDHYGAAFAYRFGRSGRSGCREGDGGVSQAHRARSATAFRIGDAAAIIDRIGEYVAADASKFILRPVARGDEEMLEQTRRLIEQVLPLVAQRWPRPAKAA